MGRNFYIVIERDSEAFDVASVPVLPSYHTQARSLDALCEGLKTV